MPMTAQQQADAYQFFIVAFGAAPGTVYMDQLNTAYDAGLTTKQIVNNYTTKEAFTARYPNFLSNGDFAASLVSNVVGDSASAAAKTEAVADITAALNSGFTRGDVIFQVFSNLSAKDKADATWGGTAQQFENQVAVAKFVTQELLVSSTDAATLRGYLSGVTQDIATVQTAKDAAVGGNVATSTMLTSGTDNITGTAGNDLFEANLAQNPGAGGISNTLSSADKIAGGGGIGDTLRAELVPEFFGTSGNNQVDIQPKISGVEIIAIEAREINTGPGSVTFDAKNVTGVNKIGSTFSDGDLVIENLTTLTDAGVARNTEAITVTMDHTDDFNSDGDASDLTVYFDEDYLLAGNTSSSTLELRLVNNLELATNDTALVAFERVSFSVAGELVIVNITPAMVALKGAAAYNALIVGIQEQLVTQGITGVTVSALPLRSAVFTDDLGTFVQGQVAGLYTPIQIVSSGATLTVGQAQVDNTTLNFNGLNTQLVNSSTGSVPITVNVELEKVGRDGEGGNLVIGGKDQNLNGDSDVDQADGISVFNIGVMGNSQLPSNMGFVSSTNQSLNTVNISTVGQQTVGKAASLTIRDAFNGDTANTTNATNVETVNANTFLGDLIIGTSTAAQNIDTFTATGGGNITLVENITGAEKGSFAITTGGGKDNITVDLDGDAVDSLNTSLTIITGAGDDVVTVTGEGDVSDATTLALGNLSISTGAGADRINVNAEHIYEVNAGADSDFVRVDANNSTVNGTTGAWSIGDGTAAIGADWADRVLYQANLTVDFAGFTQTVTINTTSAKSFVATQQDINNAVIAAIAANPELARLLVATTGTGGASDQLLNIRSTVQGQNDLSIQVSQPVVVAAGATTGQVNFNTGDLGAIESGLVATNAVANSAVITTVADVVTVMAAIDGNLNQTGLASASDFVLDAANGVDGTNNTNATSNAIINMGTGANDLVALDSDVDSSDTLVFTEAWGKVSVLNFFDNQFNDAADGAAVNGSTTIDHADSVVGNHRLDFTAFLDDKTSASTSLLSAKPIPVTLEVDGAAGLDVASNQVTIINDFAAADTTETWGNLDATQLQNALNRVLIGATAGYGNITPAADSAAAPAGLFGTSIDSIIMVENTANRGEYKVFNTEVSALATTDTHVVSFLGIIDFGESITGAAGLTLANLAGSGVVFPGTTAPALSSLSAAASVNEGATATFTLNTSNVADGTVIAYALSGINAADVVGGLLTGTATVTGNVATVNVALANDNTTEGAETLTLTAALGAQSLSANVTVNDTSTTPAGIPVTAGTVAGTAAADVFTFDVATALADVAGTNFQGIITGFAIGVDTLQIDLPLANAAITTLAQLNGEQGVTVADNPFTGEAVLTFGNDANGGEAVAITITGVLLADFANVAVSVV